MTKIIDARGLACPMPVVLVKRAIDDCVTELDILVDNEAARENILRFAASAKTAAEATAEADGEYRIRIRRDRELLIALGGG